MWEPPEVNEAVSAALSRLEAGDDSGQVRFIHTVGVDDYAVAAVKVSGDSVCLLSFEHIGRYRPLPGATVIPIRALDHGPLWGTVWEKGVVATSVSWIAAARSCGRVRLGTRELELTPSNELEISLGLWIGEVPGLPVQT